MAAIYNKFNDFSQQLVKGQHNFSSHVFKVALTNTAPAATQTTLDTVTNNPAPAAANGYAAQTTTISEADVTGTTTVQGTQVVFTAAGGQIGPFRYAILYNTSSTPANLMVGWFDYGSSITLNDTETFTIAFNNASPGTIFTLA